MTREEAARQLVGDRKLTDPVVVAKVAQILRSVEPSHNNMTQKGEQ